MGGLFAVTKESATIIVRTITTDATGKNQRLTTARSYRRARLVRIAHGRSGSAGRLGGIVAPINQFSPATNEYAGGKERTEYHNVVTWD